MTAEEMHKEFLLNEVLLEQGELQKAERDDLLSEIRLEKLKKPVISISLNSNALINGAAEAVKTAREYIRERELDVHFFTTGSLGLCMDEPLLAVQLPGKTKIVFKKASAEKVASLLDGVFNNFIQHEDVLGQYQSGLHEPWEGIPYMHEQPFFLHQKRIILQNCGQIDPTSIEQYIASGGYKSLVKALTTYIPEEVCNIVEQSELRGRGGEGYLTGKKWKIALNTPSSSKYLICNAGESDPGAFMERLFIESDPHKVVEAVAIASYAIGAQKAYIYIESSYEMAAERLEKAIQQARDYGILGHDVFQSGTSLDIEIRKGAGAYVCGEETALISHIEGKRGMPRTKPPYPAKVGLFSQPTVVNNVESLVNVPVIIQKGAEWYKTIGTDNSKGTKIFSLAGKVNHVGLVEVPMGTTIREIIYRIGGGVKEDKAFKAVCFGGPAGGCLTKEHLDIKVDFNTIKDLGSALGAGGMIVLDEDSCVVDTVKYYMDFLKNESCGKCIPCREGTRRMFEILENITRRPENFHTHTTLHRFKGVMQLENLAEVIRDTSLCGLGERAANPVLSTLRWFRDEYEEHIFERNCTANVCQGLKSFEIDVEACTGCTLCAKKCPTGAILGTARNAHFIVREKCIGCGICYDTCKFNAVITI